MALINDRKHEILEPGQLDQNTFEALCRSKACAGVEKNFYFRDLTMIFDATAG